MTGLCDLLPHSACSAAPWGPDSARTGHSPAANCEPAAAPVPTAALVWPAGSCPWHMGEDTRISAHGTPAWPAGSCPWHSSVPVAHRRGQQSAGQRLAQRAAPSRARAPRGTELGAPTRPAVTRGPVLDSVLTDLTRVLFLFILSPGAVTSGDSSAAATVTLHLLNAPKCTTGCSKFSTGSRDTLHNCAFPSQAVCVQ